MSISSATAIEQVEEQVNDSKAENQVLQAENTQLQERLEEIHSQSQEHIALYQDVIEEMAKVNIICETSVDEATGFDQVEVRIYIEDDGGRKSLGEEYILIHEENLTSSQRQILQNNQRIALGKILIDLLSEEDSPLIWLMVQYDYEDVGFTYWDLEIIREAVEDLEVTIDKPCYLEQINIG